MNSPSARPGPVAGAAAQAGALSRCAHCGARLKPADAWCTLCLTRIAVPAPAQPSGAVAEADDGTAAPPAEGLTHERIDRLLARLAAAESAAEPSVRLGSLELPPGKGQAALLAGAGGLVLLAGALLVLYILGTLV